MKKLLILIILGLPFLMFCCKDKEEIIRKVDPEIKAWGLYQKGTWWVYEEENTKIIDSFWVDTVILSYSQFKGESVRKKNERFSVIVKSKNNTSDFNLSVSSTTRLVFLITKDSISPEFESNCVLLGIPFKKGEHFSTGDVFKWTEMDTIYDSLKINGFTFKNVIRANDNGNPAFFGQRTLFYSARNFGIIRKEFPDHNEVWNLIRFNIVQ